MGKSTISMAIFHCYVSSPEGIQMITSYLQGFPRPTHCGSHLRSQISFCAGVCDGALLKRPTAAVSEVDPTVENWPNFPFKSCLSGQQKDPEKPWCHYINITFNSCDNCNTHAFLHELLIGIGCFRHIRCIICKIWGSSSQKWSARKNWRPTKWDTLWWTNIAMENGHRNSGFSH